MKKILITGSNSYIGLSLNHWLVHDPTDYSVEFISLRDELWKEKDFSAYDVIFHAAGIAHVSTDPGMESQYYKVNRDLTIEVAKKAKSERVKQFIFMSSIIVYGDGSNSLKLIDRNTIPSPSNFYGRSKLQAEEAILPLQNDSFRVAVLRPPMIYGKGSKGNYSRLSNMARKSPVFPDVDNMRSMLHIDNLCKFLKSIIDFEESGLFFPQNREYVRTSEMVRLIAESHGRNIRLIKGFSTLLKLLATKNGIINKLFGNLVYEQSMSDYRIDYAIRDLKNSIEMTER
ncbi:NAD-dependent epimerase/dehydratase family protein [Paenibacillus sp. LPE1-1-1.1]|uniref:NAD-dependent epimerase/dehydratase family protein n=1 Tax=Paenibacillus sp. LPE1-1-1.1 TaxID=3135230 RepID=UPI0034153BFB